MSFRVVTVNVNGLRAANRKGFYDWIQSNPADVICLQETKGQFHNGDFQNFCPQGYTYYFTDADTKGYSGVALFSQHEPDRVQYQLGIDWVDREGRYIQADFGKLSVASLYYPSGSSGEHRQQFKYDFMDRYLKYLQKLPNQDRSYIICGDWNIAHTKKDIKNWRSNQKTSGFLPEERQWMDTVFNDIGLVDAFRVVNREDGYYTWWSYRGRAWEKNVGWRIDYQIITPDLAEYVQDAVIYSDTRFSDHAPLAIDYHFDLKQFG